MRLGSGKMKLEYESPAFRRQLKKATQLSLESAALETVLRTCESASSKSCKEDGDHRTTYSTPLPNFSSTAKVKSDHISKSRSTLISIPAKFKRSPSVSGLKSQSLPDLSFTKKKLKCVSKIKSGTSLKKFKLAPSSVVRKSLILKSPASKSTVSKSPVTKPLSSKSPVVKSQILKSSSDPSSCNGSISTVGRSIASPRRIAQVCPSNIIRRLSACSGENCQPSDKPVLVYNDSRRYVDVEIDGNLSCLNVSDRLDIVTIEEHFRLINGDSPSKLHLQGKRCGSLISKRLEKSKTFPQLDRLNISGTTELIPEKRLNRAVVRIVDGYKASPNVHKSKMNGELIRSVGSSAEDREQEVEYDLDEEDCAWLNLLNAFRRKQHLPILSQDALERALDQFEKAAFLADQENVRGCDGDRTTSTGADRLDDDDDAVCSICLDDECQNSNAILFCDRCNLAVHQDCYGVPFVPEGQWLCRKCHKSPSKPITCVLCPRSDGAFKQTDDRGWSHVLCALWIPEVGFGSVESLEPITKIDKVPPARRRLMCSVCKQRNAGACIQCMKKHCFTAFHVSCAQQIGVYLKIEPVHENGVMVNVHKTILCHQHRPAGSQPFEPMIDNSVDSDTEGRPSKTKHKVKVKVKNNCIDIGGDGVREKGALVPKKGRKKNKAVVGGIAQDKGSELPCDTVPSISTKRLEHIADSLPTKDRFQLISMLHSYWSLKRGARNGVPLLRRLPMSAVLPDGPKQEAAGNDKSDVILSGLTGLKKLRNEMEKVRLLLELIRKREKLKREQVRQHQVLVQLQLSPSVVSLAHILDQLQEKDDGDVFAFPVDLDEVPGYLDRIKRPMDFSTIRSKVERHAYIDLLELERDFHLMISNCLKFNAKNTAYYKLALRLRKKGNKILAASKAIEGDSGIASISKTLKVSKKKPKNSVSAATNLEQPSDTGSGTIQGASSESESLYEMNSDDNRTKKTITKKTSSKKIGVTKKLVAKSAEIIQKKRISKSMAEKERSKKKESSSKKQTISKRTVKVKPSTASVCSKKKKVPTATLR